MENGKKLKRKIAVFGNAWSTQNLADGLKGVKECAKKYDFDAFIFVSYAAPGMTAVEQREEKRIYQLPEFSEFDGVLVFSSTMNFIELVYDIRDKAAAVGIPAVSIGFKIDGMKYVGTNHFESMCELVEHLVTEHGVKDVEMIAGPKGDENSDVRVEATRKVLADHDIILEEERIHYGDWGVNQAVEDTIKIVERRGNHLPDALVCVNDTLAMAVCVEAENQKIEVPGDMIVTGFDKLYDGQIFYPALCTVEQNDYDIATKASELLFKSILGEELSDVVVRNQFVPNQSCGCCNEHTDRLRVAECKGRFYEKMNDVVFTWSNNTIAEAILGGTSVAEVKDNLTKYFARTTLFPHGTSYVLIDQNAKKYFDGMGELHQDDGYTEELDVIAAVERHQVLEQNTMKRREMIPGYAKKDGINHMYIFLPVHLPDGVFGYVVVDDWLEGIASSKMKIFGDSFNQSLIKLNQNMILERLNEKLTDLYTKDSLTGMYNRFGFDTEGIKVFEKCKAEGKHMILMFTDINRMKLINDYFGHLQGDVAIRTVAEAIMKNIHKDWKAIRFGGDEFLVVGQCDCEEDIISVKERITADAKQMGKTLKVPYYLSVSCGYLYFCPEENRTIDSYIVEADAAMYDIKAKMHATDEELREFVNRCKESEIH